MSTSICETPKILNKKAMMEKKRREEIIQRIVELRDLVFEKGENKLVSQVRVLQRAVEFLRRDTASTSPPASSTATSSSSSSSSSPDLLTKSFSIGPIRSRKEIRKNREQGRRDLQGSGYDALREYISINNLGQPERLERSGVLDIIIAEIRKIKGVVPGSSQQAPSISPILPTPIINPPILPPAAIVPPILPFPIIPNPLLFYFNYLLWLQSLAQIEVQAQIEVPKTEEDDDEYIDVVN